MDTLARRYKRERDTLVRLVRNLVANLQGIAEGDTRADVDETELDAAAALLESIAIADKRREIENRITRG